MAIKQVLWDWNGTLLDDLSYAMGVRNRTFPRFGLPTINDVESYHGQFTFPVRLYYERAGVTDDIFDDVAHAWMNEYVRGCADVPLHADAILALQRLRAAGMRQLILSASQKDVLKQQLSYYPLEGYFYDVLSLGDIYARSKEAIGRKYLAECGLAPQDTVMIGDTLHDADVARAIGTRCVLVPRGHQSAATLAEAGVPLAATLAEAAELALAM